LFLIRKGECLLVSQAQQQPNNQKSKQKEAMALLGQTRKSSVPQVIMHKTLVNSIGYASPTTNTFQLGIKGAGQWVGEDFLVMSDDQHRSRYSAIATTNILCYQLRRFDLEGKGMLALRTELISQSNARIKWL